MEEQEQTFAALVLEVLMGRSAELERQWADRAQLAKLRVDDRTGDPTTTLQIGGDGTGHLVRTMLAAAAAHRTQEQNSLAQLGRTIGVKAHCRAMSLHALLTELDLLSILLLDDAEEIAREELSHGKSYDGLRVARCITEVTSQFRLAAVIGYTGAIFGRTSRTLSSDSSRSSQSAWNDQECSGIVGGRDDAS
jgi:hypothetical protein